ncbi:transcription termination/antitermination protein NusG [Buchnera aphidicola]|uniref:Transcription termination/antitermination protein NusG n=1 Tax=Buchnera aphidicola (Stegophylla sp.) TaxID=2315800 RepID=A0A4D6YMH5_9GAMM|nr:transcription termination/antitermination protein NusG [Buchnera aphidicola (Stegophylla sp.)]QCI26235.1 transcription termination/antitermination protein NusG [Buchnera aphidicola (Stegophylla sp.)]
MYDNYHMKWYVIQVFSGCENSIVRKLKQQIQIKKINTLFKKILIPTEKVIEINNGKKKEVKYRFFPGYILIKMFMNEKSWHIVRNIPKVIRFIGGTPNKPTYINDHEIKNIIYKFNQIKPIIKPKILFEIGEIVKVKDGPFADFSGVVETADYNKNQLKVLVSIFGRSTPIELDFEQVKKNI